MTESVAGEVVGFALGRREASWDGPDTSEVVSLHVLQPDQRQGVGRALIAVVAAELKRRGHSTRILSVQGAKAARRFYERLGGRLFSEKQVASWENTVADEIVYGWDEIGELWA